MPASIYSAYNASAHAALLCNAIGIRAGVISPGAAHPKAMELLDNPQSNKLLPMLAAECAAWLPNASAGNSGFGTKDFGNMLVSTVNNLDGISRVINHAG